MTDQDSVEDFVDRLVSEAPPLTDEQLDRLTALLRPSPQEPGADLHQVSAAPQKRDAA